MSEINDYEIIDKIGSGASSTVFKAKDKRRNQLVAIKTIKKLTNADDEKYYFGFYSSFLHETTIQSQLSSDGISKYFPKLLGFVYDRSTYDASIVFEYFPFDLASIIFYQSKNPTRPVITSQLHYAAYFRQMLFSLYALHSRKIVHRDIKPSNFVLNESNIIKLTDFGLSRQINLNGKEKPRNLTKQLFTIFYRPPEMLLDSNDYGYEVDVWALGLTFLEMLTSTKSRFWFNVDGTIFNNKDDADTQMAFLKYIFSKWGMPEAYGWNPKDSPSTSKAYSFFLQNIQNDSNIPQDGKPRLRNFLAEIIPPELHIFIPLLEGMLNLNPENRLEIRRLLKYECLSNENQQLDPSKFHLISIPEGHTSSQ